MPEKLLTRKDLCEMLSIGRSTLAKLVKDGVLPQPLAQVGRLCRWRADDVEAAVAKMSARKR